MAAASFVGGGADKVGIEALLHFSHVLVDWLRCDERELWVRPSSNHFLYSESGNDHVFLLFMRA
jgi:hypothetical protein